jgi:hypothetical protein
MVDYSSVVTSVITVFAAVAGSEYGFRRSIKISEIAASHAKGQIHLQFRLAAAYKLQEAFAPFIAEISSGQLKHSSSRPTKAEIFFTEGLTPLSVAIETFRPFVPEESQAACSEAWQKYRHVRHGSRTHILWGRSAPNSLKGRRN